MLNGFYTSVDRHRNTIKYRGYDDSGKKIYESFKFRPTFYLESKDPKAAWRSLEGIPLEPMTFDSMSDSREFLKQYENVEGFKVYGNDRHVFSFIQSQFPKEISCDKRLVDISYIDIETAYGNGFPSPALADHEILSIAYKSSKQDHYEVWGVGPYDPSTSLVPHLRKRYYQVSSEVELLKSFLDFWSDPENTPDVVTGWNTSSFDVPYLINRISRVLDQDAALSLSPWKEIREKKVTKYGQEKVEYVISGVQQLDYLDLFRKFTVNTYGAQESYKLDYIAEVVLDENKLDIDGISDMFKLLTDAESVKIHPKKDPAECNPLQRACLLRDRVRAEMSSRSLSPSSKAAPFVGDKNDSLLDLDLSSCDDATLTSLEKYSTETANKEAFQLGVDYNIVDVELIERFEEKLGLINLVFTLAYFGGVNYTDTLGTVTIWDTIIFRRLCEKKIAIPPAARNQKETFAGGYVKEVVPGMYDWVMSFDLNSLYPNLIVQYNMSPETLVKDQTVYGLTPDAFLEGRQGELPSEFAVAANGAAFRTDKKGFLPEIIEDLYNRRVIVKKEMLKKKSEKESMKGQNTRAIESEIARLETEQMAIKIALNSLYGAIGNRFFRYFNLQVAEGITLTGQLVIRWAEKHANEWLSSFLKESSVKDRVLAVDTDSIYLHVDDVVKRFSPNRPVEFLHELGARAVEPMLEECFARLAKTMHVYRNTMAMKREVIADRGIWTAKKRYILNVHNSEGVQYAEPAIKMMGIEAIKSSTPKSCRKAMKAIFKTMMHEDETATQKKIQEYKEEFRGLLPHEIAIPRGLSDLKKWSDKNTIFSKGTPMHVRSALIFNNEIRKKGLSGIYQPITNGSKIKYIFLKMPNPASSNVIAFSDRLPEELGMHAYIDHETQFQKAFLEPIELILTAVGWTAEEVSSLESFFC
jgi:DNA polymerase elongation subunit (family B)